MNPFKKLSPIAVSLLLALLLPGKLLAQQRGIDLFATVNTPNVLFIPWTMKYARNPFGASIASKIFLSKKWAITPAVDYVNFKYPPLDKRVGSYMQYKMGVLYFDNLIRKSVFRSLKDSTLQSYTSVEGGWAVKQNAQMIGNITCPVFAAGFGFRWYRRRFVFDVLHRIVSIRLGNGSSATYLDGRMGFGYRLLK